jgi:AcrR family transcriptional regulator
MMLYRHFGSKDELVVECLRGIVDEANTLWDAVESDDPADALTKLKAGRQADALGGTDGRGCSIANAAIELPGENQPARNLIAHFKPEQPTDYPSFAARAAPFRPLSERTFAAQMLEGAQLSHLAIGLDGPPWRFVATGEAVIASFVSRNGKRLVTRAKSRG